MNQKSCMDSVSDLPFLMTYFEVVTVQISVDLEQYPGTFYIFTKK